MMQIQKSTKEEMKMEVSKNRTDQTRPYQTARQMFCFRYATVPVSSSSPTM